MEPWLFPAKTIVLANYGFAGLQTSSWGILLISDVASRLAGSPSQYGRPSTGRDYR